MTCTQGKWVDHRIHIAFNMLFMPFEVPFEVYVRGGTVRNDDRIFAMCLRTILSNVSASKLSITNIFM